MFKVLLQNDIFIQIFLKEAHTHRIDVLVIPRKNSSRITWNKHYADQDWNYVAGIMGSAAAVLHFLFSLFCLG